jgi:branched-chain amino acid transport system substrate-binding protein
MRGRNGGSGRLWLLAILGALVLALSALAAGCGGDDEEEAAATEPAVDTSAAPVEPAPAETAPAETGPIKIGFSSNCEGPFAGFYDATLVGAMVALIERGGTPVGEKPSEGVTGATVGGREIQTVFGCSDATPDKAVEEARRLVEQEGVDILIAPLSGSEGIATAEYAKTQPDKTFLNGTSGAQDTTQKVQAPNFFRFHTDGAQWEAGLGDYAYNELGWRTVVTVADDYDFPYTQTAGFVAEFCSLGGEVVSRLWPPLGEEDYTSYIAQIPADVDGFYLSVGGTGTIAFVKQYTQLKGNLADKVIGGSIVLDPGVFGELGKRVNGVVFSANQNYDPTQVNPAYQKYIDTLTASYKDEFIVGVGQSLFGTNYYANTFAVLEALDRVNGDLSNGQQALRDALTQLGEEGLDLPQGPTTLDENRNGVGNNYLMQGIYNEDGSFTYKTLRTIENVDQTYGGNFSADTAPADRENPACDKSALKVPPWASGG